uniref:Uncharacterized protein n=1 Tax=Vespula pensylvanica TaxID=30213 RepID=A0A834NL63_VESPE|nr:hypothetical protein H0235_013001 [Vespula pensylvanica]
MTKRSELTVERLAIRLPRIYSKKGEGSNKRLKSSTTAEDVSRKERRKDDKYPEYLTTLADWYGKILWSGDGGDGGGGGGGGGGGERFNCKSRKTFRVPRGKCAT